MTQAVADQRQRTHRRPGCHRRNADPEHDEGPPPEWETTLHLFQMVLFILFLLERRSERPGRCLHTANSNAPQVDPGTLGEYPTEVQD